LQGRRCQDRTRSSLTPCSADETWGGGSGETPRERRLAVTGCPSGRISGQGPGPAVVPRLSRGHRNAPSRVATGRRHRSGEGQLRAGS
jgi:hypothetical protein